MQVSRWLIVLSLFLAAGIFFYRWFGGAAPEEVPPAVDSASPPVVTEERLETIEPPVFSSGGEKKPQAEIKSDALTPGSADVVNPFIASPEGGSADTEHTDQGGEEEVTPQVEQSQSTTRDLLKEVPDSYPIENAEAYYVPPEERYPGNLGGPPPLKLPPINPPQSASPPEAAGDGEEPSAGLVPPASF